MTTHSVFLSGKPYGQMSLVGYRPWGCRVRHDWARTHVHTLQASPNSPAKTPAPNCSCFIEIQGSIQLWGYLPGHIYLEGEQATLECLVIFCLPPHPQIHAKVVKEKFNPCYFYSSQWQCGPHVWLLYIRDTGGFKGRWPVARLRGKKRSQDLWNSSQLHSWANQHSPGSWPPLGIVRAGELMLVKSASL